MANSVATGLLIGLADLGLRRVAMAAEPAALESGLTLPQTIRQHGGLIARIAALTMFTSVAFYIMFVHIVSWLQLADGIAPDRAWGINTISMVVMLPVILLAGWASDHFGHRPLILAATALGVGASVPLLWLMYSTSTACILAGPWVLCLWSAF